MNRSWKSDASSQVEDNTEQDMTSRFACDDSVHSEDVVDESEIYEEIDCTQDDGEVSDVSHAAELSDDPDSFLAAKCALSDSDEDREATNYEQYEWLAAQSRQSTAMTSTDESTHGYHRRRKESRTRHMISSPSAPSLHSPSLETSTSSMDAMDGYALVGRSLKSGASTPKVESRQGQMSKQGHRLTKNASAKQLIHRGGTSGDSSAHSASAFRRHNFQVAGDSIDLRASGAATAGVSSRKMKEESGTLPLEDISQLAREYGMHESDEDNNSDLSLFTAPTLNPTPVALEEHTSTISKLRLVTRRKLLLSASLDGTVRVWSSESGSSSKAVLECHSFTKVSGTNSAKRTLAKTGDSTPRAVRVSSMWTDDACDAVWGGCSDGGVRVWGGADGKPMRLMKGHEDTITCIEGAESVASAMTAPHMTATGSVDKTVRVWDLRAKRPQVCTFRGHGDSILSLKWVEGGRTVVSASKDRTVKIWDTRTGRYIYFLKLVLYDLILF